MVKEQKTGYIVNEEINFSDERMRRNGTAYYEGGNGRSFKENRIIYPGGYIATKELEYYNLFDREQEVQYQKINSPQDCFTYFYLGEQEIYKVENELLEIFEEKLKAKQAEETLREKIKKTIYSDRASINYLLVVSYIGKGKKCSDIANLGFHLKHIQNNVLKAVKKLIVENFDSFKNMIGSSNIEVIKEFYNKYSDYVDDIIKLT
jgi:hypothetical protein